MSPPIQSSEDSRASKRFVPTFSVEASLLDKNLHFVHGMVANLSEAGASLLTCRGVEDGSYIAIKLTGSNQGLVETLARVVWTWDGESASEASGSLVGVSFCRLSAGERKRIWTCSSLPPRALPELEAVPFRFDQLSEPEVDWFLAREVDGRGATGTLPPERKTSSRTPPSRPWSRR